MSTIIYTFWLCLSGTVCTVDHAVKLNGNHSGHSFIILNTNILECNETDAITNMPLYEMYMKMGFSPRHLCEFEGQSL